MTNVDVIKTMYENFVKGDVPAVLGAMTPDIEWAECQGMPFVTGDGMFIGPEAVLTNVFMQLGVHIDGFNIAVTDIIGAGDKVVMHGYYQGTNKASGHPFKANAAHIWTLKDGKVTNFFQAVDTAMINS
ncbi:MAG TPA: nuclear transport factor 2 family protein [Chitinophagaceae bacterium]|nr:nuclear transport factor 2 family protein [Chitinophagaceae bacterium]